MRCSITNATPEQVRAVGASNVKVIKSANIVFADLDNAQIVSLEARGCKVSKIKEVKTATMPAVSPPAPVAISEETPRSASELVYAAGINDIRAMTIPPLYGENFNLAIVGTGIRASHELIAGRVFYSKNYTKSPSGDGFDHDTGVASIVLAVAPLCNLLDMKVLNDKGEGNEEAVTEAIDDLILLHEQGSPFAPHAINLSLGAPDLGERNSPMRVICREAVNRGIFVFASAGNGGPDPNTITSPACEDLVFAVGSARFEPFQISSFSSRGPTDEGLTKPDAIFFGENIIMASSSGDNMVITNSGTSFSCPFAAGAGIIFLDGYRAWGELGRVPSLIRQEITLPITPRELIDTFLPQACVKPEGALAGKDDDYGYGLPFGPLVREKLGFGVAALDLSTLISGVMAIGMMGIMTRSIKP